MIIGIGTDMVRISEIDRLLKNGNISKAYVNYTFTKAENAAAEKRKDIAAYYASRFAVKEAFYKAVSHLPECHNLDLTQVECLNDDTGKPYINLPSIQSIVNNGNISAVHVSITDEDDYVLAFVVVE